MPLPSVCGRGMLWVGNGHCWKCFQGQRLKVKVITYNGGGAYVSTVWCRGILVSCIFIHFHRVPKTPEIHLLIFQALKSPELGLRCWKSREILECGPERASHWWSNFLWCNLCTVEKLSIVLASVMGTGSLISVVYAVVYELADCTVYTVLE